MTEPMEQPASSLVATGAQALVDTARRLGLIWTRRPGTVTAFTSVDNVSVILDGDGVAVRAVSLAGSIIVGSRVMVDIVPPSANFIVGLLAPRGLIAYASRDTSSPTTTTEVQVLRLDNVPLKAGIMYHIFTSNMVLDSTVNGDSVFIRLRATFDGTQAVIGSAVFTSVFDLVTNSAGQSAHDMERTYVPTADETLSLLMTVGRAAGTGIVNITFTAAFPIDIHVEALGPVPPNTGVAL